MSQDYETKPFADQSLWRAWLEQHHTSVDGIWIRLYKKASGTSTVTYAEALYVALCYGWIDGQRKSYDENSFIQKFTPRRKSSLWSKRNIEHVKRLIAAGSMTDAGLAEIDRAKADGRWAAAYDAPSTMVVPDSFIKKLKSYPAAFTFFETLNKSERYAIAWRLQTAKTGAARERRQTQLIAKLLIRQKP